MSRKQKEKTKAPLESPPDDFCDWWNPTGIEEQSGAAIGGHRDAERVWARKDPGRWTRRTFGINAMTAWQTQRFRAEYYAWVKADRPRQLKPFVSLALPLKEQGERWEGVMAALKGGPQPIPDA